MFLCWSLLPGSDRVLELAEEMLEQRAGVLVGAEASARPRLLRRELCRDRAVESFGPPLAGRELLGSVG